MEAGRQKPTLFFFLEDFPTSVTTSRQTTNTKMNDNNSIKRIDRENHLFDNFFVMNLHHLSVAWGWVDVTIELKHVVFCMNFV